MWSDTILCSQPHLRPSGVSVLFPSSFLIFLLSFLHCVYMTAGVRVTVIYWAWDGESAVSTDWLIGHLCFLAHVDSFSNGSGKTGTWEWTEQIKLGPFIWKFKDFRSPTQVIDAWEKNQRKGDRTWVIRAAIKLANEMVYYSNIHIWQTFNNLVLITLPFMSWTNLKELVIKPELPPYTTSSRFLNRLSLKKMQILLCIWATALKWNIFAILKVTFSFKMEGSVGNISLMKNQ